MIFGSDLLAIEHEYVKQFIGCCANPGVSVILLTNNESSITTINEFVESNDCTSISKRFPFSGRFYDKLKEMKGIENDDIANLLVISCHERAIR